MWKRGNQTEVVSKGPPIVAAQAAPLRSINDLMRRADWEQLTDEARAALLRALPALHTAVAQAASTAKPLLTADVQTSVQDWIAALVANQFQTETATIIQRWLAQTAADAHIFIGGGPGQGRTNLVASLARQAMSKCAVPPEYCYVPDVSALDRPVVLAVPRGAGADFGEALSDTLGQICQGWMGVQTQNANPEAQSNTNNGGSSNDASGANGATATNATSGANTGASAVPIAQQRANLLAQYLDPFTAQAPELARPYLQQLRSALVALQDSDAPLPFCADNSMPVAHVVPTPDAFAVADGAAAPAAGLGAPVVVTSLSTTSLTDALLRANGGVLILPAVDAVDGGTWTSLTTALRSRSLALKEGWPPVPLAVRVALIGTGDAYQALPSDEFGRHIRYEAWTNWETNWTRETEATYAIFADGVSKYYTLPPFDPTGVARLIEEGARRVDGLNRTRLTTNLLLLHDLAFEAAQKAQARGTTVTSGADVNSVLDERRYLQGIVARRVIEAIMTGEEITPTKGVAIGQINGLGIYDTHPTERSFAVPMRISATVSLGRDERIVDIEQEASATDADHVRGLLTMEGYLTHRYGQVYPISIIARIRFEQEHGAMGGDSASGAQLFAVLSTLAQVPIRRSLAVTGAVGQYGEMQPIGGVNTKIEGFWALCRTRFLQGERPDTPYGVVIPAVNVRDIMLRPEVAASIANEGWFSILPISTVDEGLQVLTGLPAATIHERVEKRLREFYELSRKDRGVR